MSRDHRKLEVFHLVDRLVLEIYAVTKALPDRERYGLQSQLRRAAVSTATNLVEGCARRTPGEYCQFLSVAHASAREVSYEMTLCARLGYLSDSSTAPIAEDYDHAAAMLLRLIDGVR